MRKTFQNLIVLAVVLTLAASHASAQVARVFLTGTGNDANDCTNAATPCRSLQGAVNQTPLNGEIIIVASGGFGTATINHGLTINAPSGVVAFNARTININVPPNQTVTVRGLSMNGAAFGDFAGLNYTGSGTLVVEKCIFGGFSEYGLFDAGANAIVSNSEFRNNSLDGIRNVGGLLLVENSRFENNDEAGILGLDLTTTVVRNSVAAYHIYGFAAYSASSTSFLLLDHCVTAHNGDGLYASAPGGTATIRVSNSTIYDNYFGGMVWATSSGGTASIITYQNNRVFANAGSETFSGVATPF